MENIKYKQYIEVDENNNVICSHTDGIHSPNKSAIEIGETENRHWKLENHVDEEGILLKKLSLKLDSKKIVDRPKEEIEADKKNIRSIEFFNHSDREFIRVIEDITDVLISKEIIKIEELPKRAQEKYSNRKIQRGKK
jgi:hypothetical protein